MDVSTESIVDSEVNSWLAGNILDMYKNIIRRRE